MATPFDFSVTTRPSQPGSPGREIKRLEGQTSPGLPSSEPVPQMILGLIEEIFPQSGFNQRVNHTGDIWQYFWRVIDDPLSVVTCTFGPDAIAFELLVRNPTNWDVTKSLMREAFPAPKSDDPEELVNSIGWLSTASEYLRVNINPQTIPAITTLSPGEVGFPDEATEVFMLGDFEALGVAPVGTNGRDATRVQWIEFRMDLQALVGFTTKK